MEIKLDSSKFNKVLTLQELADEFKEAYSLSGNATAEIASAGEKGNMTDEDAVIIRVGDSIDVFNTLHLCQWLEADYVIIGTDVKSGEQVIVGMGQGRQTQSAERHKNLVYAVKEYIRLSDLEADMVPSYGNPDMWDDEVRKIHRDLKADIETYRNAVESLMDESREIT